MPDSPRSELGAPASPPVTSGETVPTGWEAVMLGLGRGAAVSVGYVEPRFVGYVRVVEANDPRRACCRGHRTPEAAARHGSRIASELAAWAWRNCSLDTYGAEVMERHFGGSGTTA